MNAAGAPPTFEQTLRALLPETAATAAQEPLADLDYARELDLKSRALVQFLQLHGVKPAPAPVLASPRPRGYRTTTKRRVYGSARGVGLGFAQPVKPGVVLASALEPESHARLYRALQEILSRPAYAALARVARWLILRGGYERHVLILNISGIDADVARKLKLLAALLEKEALVPGTLVSGALAYIDPTCSDYYLEAERPPQGLQIKHLWGDRLLGLEAEGKLLRFPPTVFSQVNESMVPPFLAQARALLQPQADDHMLDLYCGYGLFSHTLGAECRKVTGVELSAEAIRSAQAIAKRQGTAGRMTFHAARIDERFFTGKLGAPTGAEVALLDPPRQGCAPGVIKAVAARRPRRVLHVFCGTDEIPGELRQWKGAGYRVAAIRPLDMFPGTPGLETLVLLEPR